MERHIERQVKNKCINCGYCCKVAPCAFGIWDFQKKQCKFLSESNLCDQYSKIKDLPGAELNPAFGAGCCSSLNSYRKQILREKGLQLSS